MNDELCTHWSTRGRRAWCALLEESPSESWCLLMCSRRTSITIEGEMPEVHAQRKLHSDPVFGRADSTRENRARARATKAQPWSMSLPQAIRDQCADEVAICVACEHSGHDAHPCDALPEKACKRVMQHIDALIQAKCPHDLFKTRNADA